MSETQTITTTTAPAPTTRHKVVKDVDWDTAVGQLSYEWSDGTRDVFPIASVPAPIQADLMFHGLNQKIADAYAGAKGDVAKAKELAFAVWQRLTAGEWNGKRGTSEGGPGSSLVIEALAALKSATVEAVTERWKSLTPEQRKAFSALPEVRTKIAEIRLERERAKAASATTPPAVDLASF